MWHLDWKACQGTSIMSRANLQLLHSSLQWSWYWARCGSVREINHSESKHWLCFMKLRFGDTKVRGQRLDEMNHKRLVWKRRSKSRTKSGARSACMFFCIDLWNGQGRQDGRLEGTDWSFPSQVGLVRWRTFNGSIRSHQWAGERGQLDVIPQFPVSRFSEHSRWFNC